MSAFAARTGFTFRGWDRFDYPIFLSSMALVTLGLLLIYSGSLRDYQGPLASLSNPATKQAAFAIAGLAAMLVVSKIDYHVWVHYSWMLFILSVVALLAVQAVGSTAYGSTRWFELGPIQVQPSEFAKLAVILLLARFFSEHGGDARDVSALGISLAIVLPVAFLVFIQPDLGTALVFVAIWLGIVVIAGANRSHIFVLAGLALAILPFIWTFAVADYQVERISTLIDPYQDQGGLGAGYNNIQSRIAVGSGQILGQGLTDGPQTQDGYLKVPTRDFIFSVLAEETGFLGAMLLFGLVVLLLMRGIRAAQLAGDAQGQLIAVGIVMLLLMQTFINVAVNLSLFPVTGIPLPFVSQGGSSLVTLFVALGILQSIIMRHRAYRQT